MVKSHLILNNIAVIFPNKICFEHFSVRIAPGSQIGILGNNGTGKSTLLKILAGQIEPSLGTITRDSTITYGYIPQIIDTSDNYSGGERFNDALTHILLQDPDILLLDEPTNHLDVYNRTNLMRKLTHYKGILIVASHDIQLLRSCVDQLWAIEEGKITIFHGSYYDYIHEKSIALNKRLLTVKQLKKEQKKISHAIQAEQKRAARSKRAHKNENDVSLIELMKEQAGKTHSRNKKKLGLMKKKVDQARADIHIPEIITPRFSLKSTPVTHKTIISLEHASYGYTHPLITDITLQVRSTQHTALMGDNATGKTTFFKALLNHPAVSRSGTWTVPDTNSIGYLDQHYATLTADLTVFETIQKKVSGWRDSDIRKHLNDFLFRKNEEVYAKVYTLSGGEKARLALAVIAAQNPPLLLLDEITNNLDLTAREHVIQVLKSYPGAMIIISHDRDFLQQIRIDMWYTIDSGHHKIHSAL